MVRDKLRVALRTLFPKSVDPFEPCCHCNRDFKKFKSNLMQLAKIITEKLRRVLGDSVTKDSVRKINTVIRCIEKKCFPCIMKKCPRGCKEQELDLDEKLH